MRTLMRFDRFAEFRSLHSALDRGFYEVGPTIWRNPDTPLTFPVDLSETEEEVVVKAALPGIDPEQVEISVNDGVLTVKGETKSDESTEGENYHRREIRYGAFHRAMSLPAEVDGDKADAEFKDGILTVTLPKAEQARPKQIKIKTAAGINGGKSS